MAGMSNYLAQLLYDLTVAGAVSTRSFTSLAASYVSLHQSDPADGTAVGTELSYVGYARIDLGTTVFNGTTWSNGADLVFTAIPAGAGTKTVSHWGIYDDLSSLTGQLLYSGALDSTKIVDEGMKLVIRQGQLAITYT